MSAVRYEVVFECKERLGGDRLVAQLQEFAPARVQRGEDGPASWSVLLDFTDRDAADDFFRSDAYRQFCADVRRACQASVLLVPLGPVDV